MSWPAFLLAALKALPAIISLVARIKAAADARVNQGIGYDRAFADSLKQFEAMLSDARSAEDAARVAHEAHDDDSAFDQDFRRKQS